MTNDEALSFIGSLSTLCVKHGIRRVRLDDLEVEFAQQSTKVDPETVKAFQSFIEQGMPSDEQVLFHSVGGTEGGE